MPKTKKNNYKKNINKTKKSELSFINLIAIKLDDFFFSRPCKITNKKKYLNRGSPPIPASSCKIGTIKKGNDGLNWKIKSHGKSRRWFRENI